VEGIEAIDGTPVIDIKPVLDGETAPFKRFKGAFSSNDHCQQAPDQQETSPK
jgi:tRNA (Thr-GGU) A37 N-methylase